MKMIEARTSHTHPLEIAEVRVSPQQGRIGITFCPGKKDRNASTGAWDRDLRTDLDAISAWGATMVVTLVETVELAELKVSELGYEILRRGILWRHLPIADYSVPTEKFEEDWLIYGREIRELLRNGNDILIHCKGGLGRAGMIAARLLVELGMQPADAIGSVRCVRKGAIETPAQLALVRRTLPIPPIESLPLASDDTPLLDTSRLQRVGGQMGSNPAGIYQDASHRYYYIKSLETAAHARNEYVAAQLYKLAGAPTLRYLRTHSASQVATEWVKIDKRTISHFTADEYKQAQHWFGVHAWTANWDAAGFNGDNQGVINGKVVTLDVGGALAFRAHGDPKGKAFGSRVDELDLMRSESANPHTHQLFADMTPAEIEQSIRAVIAIPDGAIRQVIMETGGSQQLAEKMVVRKADMARWVKEYQLVGVVKSSM